MFSTFKEANRYLETLITGEYKPADALKLERITHLLKLLNNPHKKFKSIHIGGTSGKGSTAYYLSQLLAGQGYKTGLHVSPHLQTIRERMQVNGRLIPEKDFVDLVNKINPLVEKTEKDLGLGKPTYFETTVAMAFDYFAKEKVDLAVIEVGLGGKLDATNVLTPLISIITNVDLDHTDILGKTVEKIARDKSGIIKKNISVISGSRKLAVKKIIAKKCQENSSKIFFIFDSDKSRRRKRRIPRFNDRGGVINEKFGFNIKKMDFSGINFDFFWHDKIRPHRLPNLKIPIPALYQVENASLALAAIHLLKDKGFNIDKERIFKSLGKAKVPGRFEIVQKSPLIILDGAHNPVKVKTLLDSLTKLTSDEKFTFLIAFKKGKDIEQMLELLKPKAETFVITEFSKITDMGRHFTTPAEDIEKMVKKLDFPRKIIIEKNSEKALEKAKKLAGKNHPLIVTGSLYLIGETRDLFFQINHQ